MTPNQAEELATLWTASQRTVAAFIRTLLPDINEAEEVLQRVAVVLVRKIDDYDRNRPFVAWAIGVAKCEVLTYRRQHALDRHVFGEALVEQIAERYERLSQERPPVRELLAGCYDALDQRARRAIALRYVRNLPTLHIANEMRMTDTAIRKLLSRARIALRDCINRRLREGRVDQ